jgi:hypothetical protein
MITQFKEWSENLQENAAFSSIAGSTIGIEAAEYLNRIQEFRLPRDKTAGVQPEPLLPALGGVPFGLARVVRIHLEIWRRYNIKPIFVFSGLNLLKDSFAESEQASRRLAEAWTYYDANNAALAVETFKESKAVKATDLFRFLQTILRENSVAWMVAPYTASAQVSCEHSCNSCDSSIDANVGHSFTILLRRTQLTPRSHPPKSSSLISQRTSHNLTSRLRA